MNISQETESVFKVYIQVMSYWKKVDKRFFHHSAPLNFILFFNGILHGFEDV